MNYPSRWCIPNYIFIIKQQINPGISVYIKNREKPTPITVVPKKIKYQNPSIQVDLKIPEIHGMNNKNIEKSINNSIQSDVMEFKREMEQAAKEHTDEAIKSGKKLIPYVISSIYKLNYNKNNIISISMVYHEYLNGLNSYIKAPYNFDIVTGKALSLEDLFIHGVDYKSLINREVRDQLIKNKEKYFPNTIEKFKGVAEDQPFYLENGCLVVFFGFNEIAPTEAQIPVFKIPFSNFINAVKPILLRRI